MYAPIELRPGSGRTHNLSQQSAPTSAAAATPGRVYRSAWRSDVSPCCGKSSFDLVASPLGRSLAFAIVLTTLLEKSGVKRGLMAHRSFSFDQARDIALAKGDLAQLHVLQSNGVNLLECDPEAVRQAIRGGHWAALRFWFQVGGQVAEKLLGEDIAYGPVQAASDPIVTLARQHLVATLSDSKNRALPFAGPRWQAYSLWARTVIRHLDTPTAIIQFAQNSYGHGGFESRISRDETELYATNQEIHLANRFPQFKEGFRSFVESAASDPDTTTVVFGRPVSAPLYANMTFFLECHARLDPYPQAVCEIGGGYGGPARLWLTNAINRPRRYVIVDLPESLFFSEVFLKCEFGPKKVHYVASPEPIEDCVLDEAAVVLCPVPFYEALRETAFDLAYNTLSMQEMSDAYVDFYSAWLDRQKVSHFYSFNYAAQPADEHPESANWGAPRLSRKWHPVWVGPYAAGPSPAVHVLAQKHENEADWIEEGRQILDECMARPCDASTFTLMIMAVRLVNQAAETCSVIRRALSTMTVVPREIMLLISWLSEQNGSNALSAEDLILVEQAKAALLAHGEAQGKAAPYLETIRSSLPRSDP